MWWLLSWPVFYRAMLMKTVILMKKPGFVTLGLVRRDPAI
jgi:hypothetical protein